MSSCDGMFILLGGVGIMRAIVGNYLWEKVPLLLRAFWREGF